MILWLVGQKGVGKTTTAIHMADNHEWVKADTDHELTTWRKLNIPTIISQEGETQFRNYETQIVHKLAQTDPVRPVVIATGGGTCERPENRQAIKASGTVIYLHTHNYAGWKEWYRHRDFYHIADHTIYTDRKTVEQVVQIILEKIQWK